MAIQLRRGAYADFDPQKMKPAEVAVVQQDDPTSHDGKAVYVAISPGDVKRMAVLDELQDEVYNQIDTALSTATQAAVATATQAAAESASEAAASASEAAESARTLTIDSTLTQPGQAADAKSTSVKIHEVKDDLTFISGLSGSFTGESFSPWESGKTINASGEIGSSGAYSACSTFIKIPDFVSSVRIVTGAEHGAIFARYSAPDSSAFIDRTTYTANHGYDLDVSEYKYIRIANGSLDVEDVQELKINVSYPLKETIASAEANVAHLLSKALSTDNNDATSISANTDYDNIKTSGNYYCSSSANAQSMANCPVAVAHRLIVITTTSSNRIWQIILPNANTDVYMRTNLGSWNEWNKLITTRSGVESNDVRITASNYSTLLPDLNTAKDNIVYSIAPNVPILNIPEGNYNVAGADQSYGVASGTLVTLRGASMGGGYEKLQIFMSAAGLPEGGVGSILNFRGSRYSGGRLVWDKWSKVGNGINLRATNTFIQESRIQAGTAMFSDMNDAPNNTIVQIDLDAVSMANNPMTGHSCVLVTFCPSYISRHGMLQLCSGIEGGVAHLFFRYGWQNAPGDIRWSPWMECTATQVL